MPSTAESKNTSSNMTLRIKYIIFVAAIHLVLLGLTYQLLKEQIYFFIASELLLFLSIYIAYRLYLGLIKPIDFIATSISAIEEEDFSIKFRKTGSGELNKLIEVYNQMIDKIREERTRLQEQHFFLTRIIEASPTAILILDFNEHISMYNPAASKLLGWSEIPSTIPISELQHPVISALPTLSPGQSQTLSTQGLQKIKCQCTTFVDRGFERKIYLLEELTDDILSAEKKAYGKVIRMMAHEVNNSIGPINSILQSILNFSTPYSTEDTNDIKEYIEVALDRNQKLNQFTRNFADIIRLPLVKLQTTDIHASISRAAKLMTVEAEELSIQIEVNLLERPINVALDQDQFEQVLINIIKNSIESIGHQGTIKITTSDKPVKIVIADNGAGISKEQSSHLFTPFYSTKTTGQGIGLTLTREVLHQHKADFSLKTKSSGWTEFEILFPRQL